MAQCCIWLYAAFLASRAVQSGATWLVSSCETGEYYASVDLTASGEALQSQLHARVSSPHEVLPYTSSDTDTWDALEVLDADPNDASQVRLIYSQTLMPIGAHTDQFGWNREHVWPKSYGVGYDGPDFSDVHSLRAADWGVNSARSNLFFDILHPTDTGYQSPAHSEAAADTAKTGDAFMPPAAVRGDLARALFYMAVRYDGNEADTEDLILSSCPRTEAFALGKLSTLLQWHVDDPVDDVERARNHRICTDFQRNRNPFIDHPSLVSAIWAADAPDAICGNMPGAETLTTTTVSESTCFDLQPGDVVIIGFAADYPDGVAFATLRDLPAGAVLAITDDAWTGAGWRGSEGALKFTVPQHGLARGTVVTWHSDGTGHAQGGTFEVFNFLALSTAGEQLLLYEDCATPRFLFGVDYSSGGWRSEGETLSARTSVAPHALLAAGYALDLPHMDSYLYDKGVISGTRSEILTSVMSPSSWTGSDSFISLSPFELVVITDETSMAPEQTITTTSMLISGTCSFLQPGDVAILGFNSDSPDGVAFVALRGLPAGAVLSITDDAWTGSGWRGSEGTLRYTVPGAGLPSGTVVTWDADGTSDARDGTFEILDNFALSTAGEQLLVYEDCDRPLFLFGVDYSSGGWGSENGALSSTVSVAPDELLNAGYALDLPHSDNYAHNKGVISGTRSEILASIMSPSSWTGSNSFIALPTTAIDVVTTTSLTTTTPTLSTTATATSTTLPSFSLQATSTTAATTFTTATSTSITTRAVSTTKSISITRRCFNLQPGDVAIIGFNSDSPDGVAFVALRRLLAGTVLAITDDAWTGSGWRGSEGTLKYTVPEVGLASGAIVTWHADGTGNAQGGTFEILDDFAVSTAGEQLLVYENCDRPLFLFGVDYSSGGWASADDMLSARASVAPDALLNAGYAMDLPHSDNYAYDNGIISGMQSEILASIMSPSSWTGSDSFIALPTIPIDVVTTTSFIRSMTTTTPNLSTTATATSTTIPGFSLQATSTTGTTTSTTATRSSITAMATSDTTSISITRQCFNLQPGDVAIIGFNSDSPDGVAFVALRSLLSGTVLAITDDAWLGSGWRGNEGTLRYTVPEAGLASGAIVTWHADGTGNAQGGTFEILGDFAVSTAGEQLLVYEPCDTPLFLFGVDYSSDGWRSESDDPTDPVVPEAFLATGYALDLPHVDNNVYDQGVTSGTRSEILTSIMSPISWTGSNSLMSLPAGEFNVTGPVFTTTALGTAVTTTVTIEEGLVQVSAAMERIMRLALLSTVVLVA